MARYRRYHMRKHLCPTCGKGWRFHTGYGAYWHWGNPKKDYPRQCPDAWHREASVRMYGKPKDTTPKPPRGRLGHNPDLRKAKDDLSRALQGKERR